MMYSIWFLIKRCKTPHLDNTNLELHREIVLLGFRSDKPHTISLNAEKSVQNCSSWFMTLMYPSHLSKDSSELKKKMQRNIDTIFKYILALSYGATRVLPGDAPILLVTQGYGQKQAYQHLPAHSFQGRYHTSLSAMPLGKTL